MSDTLRKRKNDNLMTNDTNSTSKSPTKIEMKTPLSKKDKKSICLLTFLYVLQGIPLGLAGAVPYLLQSRKVSYTAQATFSFAFWPFSMKILWAPIVDCVYSEKFGRRKSWLIPAQLCIGFTMLLISYQLDLWMSDGSVAILTGAFFFLNFLAATQDIAVDGWALTMLSKSAVGWASTCNSVGQTTGYFTAFIVFLALESTELCNNWLRSIPQNYGLVTFSGFTYFWGVIFLTTTILVMIFKHEEPHTYRNMTKTVPISTQLGSGDNVIGNNKHSRMPTIDSIITVNDNQQLDDEDEDDEEDEAERLGIIGTYKTLWSIIRLRPVIYYLTILFLIKTGFSASDSITGLKLIEKGVSKEKMAFIGSLVVPVQILLALLVSKYTTGNRPLNIFIFCSLPRYLYGLIFAFVVYISPNFQQIDGTYSFTYYVALTMGYASHQMFVYPMFVSIMAFYARISDPNIGGTYMTLLNTFSNLAANIPNTMVLYLVDVLSVKSCIGGDFNGVECTKDKNVCGTRSNCEISFDAYYTLVVVSTGLGLMTLWCCRRTLHWIQQLPLSDWTITA